MERLEELLNYILGEIHKHNRRRSSLSRSTPPMAHSCYPPPAVKSFWPSFRLWVLHLHNLSLRCSCSRHQSVKVVRRAQRVVRPSVLSSEQTLQLLPLVTASPSPHSSSWSSRSTPPMAHSIHQLHSEVSSFSMSVRPSRCSCSPHQS